MITIIYLANSIQILDDFYDKEFFHNFVAALPARTRHWESGCVGEFVSLFPAGRSTNLCGLYSMP
jgi:hypothetical protein